MKYSTFKDVEKMIDERLTKPVQTMTTTQANPLLERLQEVARRRRGKLFNARRD